MAKDGPPELDADWMIAALHEYLLFASSGRLRRKESAFAAGLIGGWARSVLGEAEVDNLMAGWH